MKPIQLLALSLIRASLTNTKIEKCGGEFRVRVNNMADLITAEAVVAEFNARFGYDADVAF